VKSKSKKDMNILFLYGGLINPTKGGVQRVTKVLADYFELQGNSVYFLSLMRPDENEYIDQRQFVLPDNKKFNTKENIQYYKEFITKYSIDVVVNQGGLGKDCSRLANYSNDFGAVVLSVLHNSPLAKIIHFSSSQKGRFSKPNLDFLLPLTDLKWVKKTLLWIYKFKYRAHFKELCEKSDRVVLLSETYRDEFLFFTGRNWFEHKITAISNPCSFSLSNDYKRQKKEKILLFVGRLAFGQKRVDLLIEIWNKLYRNFPDWRLVVVGDGPDLGKAKEIASNLETQRIYFEGRQNSEPYYDKASVFCMTSSYEGFPMVIAEAQTYGTVPVAFNSFASIADVIENEKTGFLIEAFDLDDYVNTLSALMSDDELLQTTSKNCVESAKQFSLEQIGDQWLQLFNSLLKEDSENN
jgi:glycosyltransferase involved in cell wall biosynthesis